MNKSTKLISRIKHDVKTPIHSIIGYASLIEKISEDSTIKQYCQNIFKSCITIENILEDIFDFSLIFEKNIVIENEVFSISKIIEEIKSIFSLQANLKKQIFVVEASSKSDEYFIGDKKLITKILLNLINNSIKYTKEKGKITFSTFINKIDEENSKLTFIILDNGMGIEKDLLDKIFLPFKRGQRINNVLEDGLGLGLAITIDLINMLKGTIKVESTVDKGSKFIVELNVKNAQNDYRINFDNLILLSDFETKNDIENAYINTNTSIYYASEEFAFFELLNKKQFDIIIIDENYISNFLINSLSMIKNEENHIFILGNANYEFDYIDGVINKPFFSSSIDKLLSPKEVIDFKNISFLLVEDNIVNQEITKELIKLHKGLIEVVSSGKECINKLKSNIYDVVLIDFNMPELNGLDTLKIIKENNLITLKTISIALSSDISNKNELLNHFDYVLEKPINIKILYNVLKNAKNKLGIK